MAGWLLRGSGVGCGNIVVDRGFLLTWKSEEDNLLVLPLLGSVVLKWDTAGLEFLSLWGVWDVAIGKSYQFQSFESWRGKMKEGQF